MYSFKNAYFKSNNLKCLVRRTKQGWKYLRHCYYCNAIDYFSLSIALFWLTGRLDLKFLNAIGGREIYARLYKIALYPPPSPFKIRRRERHTDGRLCLELFSLLCNIKKEIKRERGRSSSSWKFLFPPPPSGERTDFSLSSLPLSVWEGACV